MQAQEMIDKAIADMTEGSEEALVRAEAGFNILLNENRDHPDILFYTASCAMKRGFYAVAEILLKRSADINPDNVACWNNLGFIAKQENRDEDAIEYFEKAIDISEGKIPDKEMADLYSNLGSMIVSSGDPQRAISLLSKSIKYHDTASARWNRGLAYLEIGDWKRGWEGYEAGFEMPDKRKNKDYGGIPVWNGENGKVVIVYGEQGIGDEIMFASMIKDLQEDCKKVIIDAHPRLAKIFRNSFDDCAVYGTRKTNDMPWLEWEQPEYRISMASLGKFYRLHNRDFPRNPYLWSDSGLYKEITPRMAKGKLKIGISWKGGTRATRKDQRTIPLHTLKPLLDIDAEFYSLQYTDGADKELKQFEEDTGIHIHHWQDIIDDYDKTAAMIRNLDLIITVPQSIMHLAGAMGVRVLQLAPYTASWQMGVKGKDYPWYRCLKSIYQPSPGDWDEVVNQAKEKLCLLLPKNIAA